MSATRGILACLLACGFLRAAEPPLVEPKIGRPVLQELMGGCSLTCALPWDASAGSRMSKLSAINDSDASTAWTDARAGDRLVFKFLANLPRELNGTPFYGIDFANGRLLPRDKFKDFGRIRELLLSHNGKPVHRIRLADTPRWQQVEFDDIFLDIGDTLTLEILETYPGDTLTLEILETYPGGRHPTAALTEIVLQGAH